MSDTQIVDLLYVDDGKEIAVVRIAAGAQLGINLWELESYKRRCDGYRNWLYATAAKAAS